MEKRQELNEGIREVIFGQSGSGKSTLGRAKFIKYIQSNARERYYVIDVAKTHIRGNQYLSGLDRFGFKAIYVNYTTLSKTPPTEADLDEKLYVLNSKWRDILDKNRRAVIVIEMPMDITAFTANAVAQAILELGNAVVLMDEVSKLVPNTQQRIDAIGMMICSGRGVGVDTISIAQHRNLSHKVFMQEANWVTTFKTTDELDLSYLKDRFGEHVDKIAQLDREKREFMTAHLNGAIYKSDLNLFLTALLRKR